MGSFVTPWDFVAGFSTRALGCLSLPFPAPSCSGQAPAACREAAGLLPSAGGLTGFVGAVHGARRAEDRTLRQAVSTPRGKSIPLGAPGLAGTSVWPGQCDPGLSWRLPQQAAPPQQACPLHGGCKSQTRPQCLRPPALGCSALPLPSPTPRSFVTQVRDRRRAKPSKSPVSTGSAASLRCNHPEEWLCWSPATAAAELGRCWL